MAALTQPQSLEELITCPICMERMKNPKHLYCQHAFCDQCLVDWTSQPGNETKSISCPVCRKCTRLSEGIEELPADIAINNLLGIVDEQSQTPICGKDNAPAAAFCGECDHNLCHVCVNTHIKDDAFKQHMPSIKEMSCFNHNSNPQTLYCTDCTKQGCSVCMEDQHKGHSVTDVAVVAKINKATLQYLNQSLRDLVKNAKEFPNMTSTVAIRKKYNGLRLQIQIHAETIRLKMEQWKTKIEGELEERSEKHINEVSEMEAHIATCEDLMSNIEHFLKVGSDVLLTTTFSATSLRLHEATTPLNNIPRKEGETADFKPRFDRDSGEYGSLVDGGGMEGVGGLPKKVGKDAVATITKPRSELVPEKSVCSISSQTAECGSETSLVNKRQPLRLIGYNRAEITFQYTFEHLSLMKKRKESTKFVVRNIPWNIILDPREKSMDFFLCPNVSSKESKESKEPKEPWSCTASVMLKILNWKPYLEPFKRKFKHVYDQALGWGYTDFITWKELMNPKKGFVKDDKMRVEARIMADMPVGISPAECEEKIPVHVVTKDSFSTHQASDLFDPDCCRCHVMRVDKKATLGEFMEVVADSMQYTPQQLRPWPFVERDNETFRPEFLDVDTKVNITIEKLASDHDPWTLFIETPHSRSAGQLPSFDMNSDVLLFFKHYIPETQSVIYSGHKYVPVKDKLERIIPLLNERAGFPKGTELNLYQEVKADCVNHITQLDRPLEDVVEELSDGDIIIFQRKDPTSKSLLPTEFFKYLHSSNKPCAGSNTSCPILV